MGALLTGGISIGSNFELPLIPTIYFLVISLVAIIVCIYDKKISKKNKVELRIPEKNLLIISALGGSIAMLLTMLAIRHKTKHVKFMLGIPLIIIAQIAIAVALIVLI